MKYSKKILMLLVIFALSIAIVACDTDRDDKEMGDDNNATTKNQVMQYEGDKKDIGDGEVTLMSSGNKASKGEVLNVSQSAGEDDIEIKVIGENIDSSKETYIFVDDKLLDKEMFDETDGEDIDLKAEAITKGDHKLQFVQFEKDDPKGTVTFYREMSYKVQ